MKGQFPWIGRSRGSAGGMTTAKINDKNVMRAKALEVSNPNTPAQQTQRDFFKQLQAACAQLSADELRWLFPQKPKGMTRRNALAKQLAECFTMDGSTKNLDLMKVSKIGSVPELMIPNTELSEDSGNLYLSWENPYSQDDPSYRKTIAVLLFDATTNKVVLYYNNSQLGDEEFYLTNAMEYDSTHNYAAALFISNSTDPTLDFGSFIIKTRAEKQGRQIGKKLAD